MTSHADYLKDPCPEPSLNATVAKVLLNKSPMHAWMQHPRLNPKYQDDNSSRFDLGTFAHSMLLEGDDSRLVIIDADDWRTKAAKEERDAAWADDKLPLLRKDYDKLREMVDAAYAYLAGTEIDLSQGVAEQTFTAKDSCWLRCRADWISNDQRVIVDYKTTTDASPEAFARQIGRMGYDVQAELYCRVVEHATGERPEFVFLAQETEYPYACSLVGLSESYKAVGAEKVQRAIDLFAQCLATNKWPAYTNRIAYAEPAAWQINQLQMGEEE